MMVGQLVLILLKDTHIVLYFLLCIFSFMLWSLIHPDNWGVFDTLATPEHIEPELYFLWTFALIKLHNSKLAGVLIFISREPIFV